MPAREGIDVSGIKKCPLTHADNRRRPLKNLYFKKSADVSASLRASADRFLLLLFPAKSYKLIANSFFY
jgi:hypothetical protein